MAGLSLGASARPARLRVPDELLVDRYYRGAIVMTGASTFAIPEAAIALVERVRRATTPYLPTTDDERELAAALIARGVLTGDSR